MPSFAEVQKKYMIPLRDIHPTVATWAITLPSELMSFDKTGADNTSVLHIPLSIPRRTDFYGVRLEAINVYALIGTANLDAAPTLVLSRNDYDAVNATASSTSAVTKQTIATTASAGVVATFDADIRKLTWTIDSPAADHDTELSCSYHAALTLDAAASTVIKIYGVELVYKELN
jgi:hypothetical protein